jgi:hypothetical protein
LVGQRLLLLVSPLLRLGLSLVRELLCLRGHVLLELAGRVLELRAVLLERGRLGCGRLRPRP